ncbi:peptidylprolyl isomerase FKBP-type [Pseudopedobacter saltans DSM 12145]|uniref:Peptidyl-prolyl cis-trans isomerase n=1 Tax=Pseudopedobacter saltans (strain ATCC 51119 / DSM 12145 / JCM 21818 / CCUG 39354 / LMG 10337 / NBRC 100064 / NCIMB 13643) TaxID=762903 RepID=F0S5I0_PSESL|nr:FKBP-type peptidyl-prolyl cis-trans isomerase [Pseudopedobacter saltans]ADY53144.1 peptidylprolyl isomerase FKBP-type [Pseudopedobacter saltans DSM 12145]
MIKKILGFVLTCSIFLGACTKETRTLQEIEELSIKEFLTKNNLTSKFKKDSTGFYYMTVKEGHGDTLQNYNQAFFLLELKSLEGTDIATTSLLINSAETYSYMPNLNSVKNGFIGYVSPIGLRNVLLKAKYGEKIRALLPSYVMFGKNGYSTVIKGNTVLDATLDIINAKTQAAAEDTLINRYIKTTGQSYTKDEETGLYYRIINEGTGAQIAIGSTIKAVYTGKLFNGKVFDSSTKDSPFETTIYNGSLITGWIEGIQKIKKGGRIELLIPSYLAYGANGSGAILPNTPLYFDIEVLAE